MVTQIQFLATKWIALFSSIEQLCKMKKNVNREGRRIHIKENEERAYKGTINKCDKFAKKGGELAREMQCVCVCFGKPYSVGTKCLHKK